MQIERYRIESEIGRGATATVYKAFDTRAGKYVALKLLHRKFTRDAAVRARFIQEAKTVAGLSHPAITPILHAAQAGEHLFLVMPLMAGGSLATRLRHGPLSTAETFNVLERIAAALDYAHQQEVIHRDVKPGNILFDESGQVYLSDFGVIKRLDADFTLTGVGLIGTPAYMSPEQLHTPKLVKAQSDIYSLGVVLFEMLSGRIPFDGDSEMSIALKHLNAPVPSLRTHVKTLRPGWQKVVNKAMAKKPEDRYRSGAEMLAAAGAVTDQQSLRERLETTGLLGMVGGMIALLLLGAAVIFFMVRLPSFIQVAPTPTAEFVTTEIASSTPVATTGQPGGGLIVDASGTASPTSTPSATPTPTPTATLTRTSSPSSTPDLLAVRATTNIYTREGPGMEFPIFGSLTSDQTVRVVARDRAGFWFLVRLSGGQLVWVSAAYVTEPEGEVPVAATLPALPTATVTPTPTVTSTPSPLPPPPPTNIPPRTDTPEPPEPPTDTPEPTHYPYP